MELLNILGFGLLGYLSGSLSFALWVTRLVKGIDVRDAGSHHASTTNTVRQVGWGAGVVVLIGDVAKGFIPVYLASTYGISDWAIPVTGALAVAGHCWPVFAQFRGGMGLATAGGAILAVYPFGFLLGIGVLISMVLLIKHSARGALITGVLLAPTFWLFGERGLSIWLGASLGFVLAVRFFSDWNRVYKELWLDRDKESA